MRLNGRHLVLAGLAALALRSLATEVMQCLRLGPLSTPLEGHPPWLTPAYYRWLEDRRAERQLKRAVEHAVPAGSEIGVVATTWGLTRVRYHLWPRRAAEHEVLLQSAGDYARLIGHEPWLVLIDEGAALPSGFHPGNGYRLHFAAAPYALWGPAPGPQR